MSSPWDLLDDELQSVLRPIFTQELDRMFQPYYEAEEDRQLAEQTKHLSLKYPDFGPKQVEVLLFAIDNGIADIEAAYHAMRGMTAESQPPAAPSGATSKEADREAIEATDAQEGIPLDEVAPEFRAHQARVNRQLKRDAARDDQDAKARALLRESSPESADAFRRSVIEEMNAEADVQNRAHTTRSAFGHHDSRRSGRAKSTEEKYAEMDLKAVDLFRAANEGRTLPKTSQPARTRNQRDRDEGFDVRERAVLAGIREDQASAREIAAEIDGGQVE